MLADARAELARRQQTSIDLAVERRRLEHAVTAADQTVRKIDAATRPDRHALDADERAADQARLALHAAQRRLESSTLRTRRSARRDVRDAEVQLQLATGDLAETRMRTASNVGRFTRAVAAHADAHDHLRHHRLSNQLHAVSGGVEPAQRRVDALETWQLWATGQNISPRDIHDTIDHLIDRRTWTRTPERVLGEAINAWATRSGIQPADGPANRPARRHAGIELGF